MYHSFYVSRLDLSSFKTCSKLKCVFPKLIFSANYIGISRSLNEGQCLQKKIRKMLSEDSGIMLIYWSVLYLANREEEPSSMTFHGQLISMAARIEIFSDMISELLFIFLYSCFICSSHKCDFHIFIFKLIVSSLSGC